MSRRRSIAALGAVLPFLLAGAGGGDPVPGEDTHLPFRIELDDGSWVEGRSPVERRGGLLVFRLLADGRAASVPEGRVVTVTPLPVPSSGTPPGVGEGAAGPGPAERAVAARSSPPRVYSNVDLPPPLEASPAIAADNDAFLENLEPLTYEGYRDDSGRDEAWWRERVKGLREEIALAELEAARALASLRAWEGLFLEFRGRPGRPMAPIGRQITVARRELEEAEDRLDALRAEWEALAEEARTSGALPGWLR